MKAQERDFVTGLLNTYKNEFFEYDELRFFLCEFVIKKIRANKKIKERHELCVIVEAANYLINTSDNYYNKANAYLVLQEIDTNKKI